MVKNYKKIVEKFRNLSIQSKLGVIFISLTVLTSWTLLPIESPSQKISGVSENKPSTLGAQIVSSLFNNNDDNTNKENNYQPGGEADKNSAQSSEKTKEDDTQSSEESEKSSTIIDESNSTINDDGRIQVMSVGEIMCSSYYPINITKSLTPGEILPLGATIDYQWQSATTRDGTYIDIDGATSRNFYPSESEVGKYIRVIVKGVGNYTGVAISSPTGSPVATIPISSVSINPSYLYFDSSPKASVSPTYATVTYQWQSSDKFGGPYNNIAGATYPQYNLTTDEFQKYIRVVVSGYGGYSGTIISTIQNPVAPKPIGQFPQISGDMKVGGTLRVGNEPSTMTVTYQWQSGDSVSGPWTNLTGKLTTNYYTLTSAEVNKYIRVEVLGYGYYTGGWADLAEGKVQP